MGQAYNSLSLYQYEICKYQYVMGQAYSSLSLYQYEIASTSM
jgi:hypothetical protein